MKNLQKIIFTAMGFSLFSIAVNAQVKELIPMVNIPAGSFYMGGTGIGENFDEAPVHKVVISHPFRLGKTEITNAQYEEFCPEHKVLRGKNGLSKADDEAVIFVSYNDAMAFCKWLSKKEGKTYRLPTEAEWEYACRAGSCYPFSMGDGLPAVYLKDQRIVRDYQSVSLKVGQTPANAFGIYDMHGNVEEWCNDWYGPYSSEVQTDPVGQSRGEFRVTRGGSHSTPETFLRSSNRMAMIPEDKHALTGFRIVQAEYPASKPLTTIETALNSEQVSLAKAVWKKQDKEPLFMAPIPFVVKPDCSSKTPFYQHNHQPAITWCDNGDLLAIWFSAEHENGREMAVLASRLRAGAKEWDEASPFFKVPDRNITGSALMNDGNGTLYHINGVEAAGDWQNLMMIQRTSCDNGKTWTSARIIEPEHAKRHQVIAGTIKTKEGWFIQFCDAGPGGKDSTAVHISKDGGQTWTDTGGTIAGIHAGVVQLKDGRLMAFGRNNNVADSTGRMRMPMSISSDVGKTWTYSASEFPSIEGQQRLVLRRLDEGPLLLISFTDHPLRTAPSERGMIFKDKNGKEFQGYGMYAALSFDEGKTWAVKKLLTDGVSRYLNGGAWTQFFEMDATHAEPRGYLAATQTPDNVIHLVSSRLHYRFNLSWLLKNAD